MLGTDREQHILVNCFATVLPWKGGDACRFLSRERTSLVRCRSPARTCILVLPVTSASLAEVSEDRHHILPPNTRVLPRWRDTPCVRLKDWRWNRETRRWELVETGEEFTPVEAVRDMPLPGALAIIAGVGVAMARLLVAWSRKRRRASTLSS